MEYSTPGPTVPVIYVNAARTGQGNQDGLSWATAFADLQDALASAESGDEIWVAAGIYYPDEAEAGIATVSAGSTNSAFTMLNGVTIYGGFNGTETSSSQRNYQSNLTILSGDLDKDDSTTNGIVNAAPTVEDGDNASYVVVASGTDNTAVLDGVVVTAGCNGYVDGLVNSGVGAGLYAATGFPTVRNCSFIGNHASSGGAGIALSSNNSGGSAIIENCLFQKNYSYYGGVAFYSRKAESVISSCEFTENTGGQASGMIEIRESNATLENSLIAGNYSEYLAGILLKATTFTVNVTNTTVANNYSTYSEDLGAIYCDYTFGSIHLTNTIAWGNQIQGNAMIGVTGDYSATYSLFEGVNPSGTGNIDGTNAANDPLFLSTINPQTETPSAAGDYRLAGNSAAVDSGNNTAASSISYDIAGNTRITNSTVDLGAYEYNGPSPVSTESVTLSVQEGDGEANYAVDFNTIFGRTDLTYSLVSVTPSDVIYHEYDSGYRFATYAAEGAEAGDSATVTIQVTDEDGNTTQFTFTVTVIPAPVAPSDALAQSMSSWYTDRSSRFARIFETYNDESNGTSVTTWDNGTYSQNTPVFAGPQEISYTDNYVYVKTPNLTTHIMGPWYNDNGPGGSEVVFNNWPSNQAMIYKIPRLATIPASKTAFEANSIGIMVDGTVLFSTSDTFSWDNDENGSGSGSDTGPGVQGGGQGDGIWTHEAAVTEGNTFDKSNSHGAGDVLHYHASPTGLRYLLGDNMDYDASTNTYTPVTEEDPEFNNSHSPIIGWMNDGLPIYGPYGYSDPYDSTSSVRRMVRGFIKRDGSNGTYNLTSNGRTALAAWNARILGIGTEAGVDQFNLTVNQQGPNVSSDYPIGYFMEDYAYKGDLAGFSIYDGSVTFNESIHYDLNEQNVRYCVTPEFPDGTWAYFTNVDSDGVPQFPYNVAQQYYGNPDNGGSVNSIPTNDGENVVTFQGGINKQETISEMVVSDGTVLVWSGVEGGTYLAEVSTDMSNWTPHGSDPSVSQDKVTLVDSPAVMEDQKFFRITRLTDPTYDDTPFGDGSGGGGGGSGSTVDFAFTFGTTPPLPQEQEINSATVGGVTATIVSYDSGTGNVTLSFDPSSLSGPSTAQLQFVASGGPQAGNTVTLTSTNTYSP